MTWRRYLLRIWSLWPPFLGAGIRITYIAKDFRRIDVKLILGWWNANLVGTSFGGSIYAMTDPFYMVMLLNLLGRDYIVWDKSACIKFLKPGRTNVFTSFILTDEIVNDIKNKVSVSGKIDYPFKVEIKDTQGQIIAEVEKTVYIRKKR